MIRTNMYRRNLAIAGVTVLAAAATYSIRASDKVIDDTKRRADEEMSSGLGNVTSERATAIKQRGNGNNVKGGKGSGEQENARHVKT